MRALLIAVSSLAIAGLAAPTLAGPQAPAKPNPCLKLTLKRGHGHCVAKLLPSGQWKVTLVYYQLPKNPKQPAWAQGQ